MKSWVKVYTEINHDPKMLTLSWSERGIWSALLAVAGEIDDRDKDGIETGRVDSVEYTAIRIRCDREDLELALLAFDERGMVETRGGVLYLCNYGARQGRAPSDRPDAVADRVKRHRERVTPSVVTECNEDVTSAKRGVTASDTDTESDTDRDTDTEVGAIAPPVVMETPKTSRSDPRTKHPAIALVKGITGRNPNKAVYDQIIGAIGENPRGEDAAACYREWITRGYNPNALTWLTEWYPNGIPAHGGYGNGSRASPSPPPKPQPKSYRNPITGEIVNL